MRIRASIDIGTNTALLLVAQQDGDSIHSVREESRVPRLGKGVDESKVIQDASVHRLIEALKEYKSILESEYSLLNGDVIVTATSALRDAKNGSDVINAIKENTGFSIQLLSGDEEAQRTFAGAICALPQIDPDKSNCVIDIGGGSTELAFGKNGQLERFHSYDMGAVRFTERFLKTNPPLPYEITACSNAVHQLLMRHPITLPNQCELIGVAGTVTTLAYVFKRMDEYIPEEINGTKISRQDVANVWKTLHSLSHSRLEELYPVVMKGRADIFQSGMIILMNVMDHYKFKHITVSTGGIRHGMLLNTK